MQDSQLKFTKRLCDEIRKQNVDQIAKLLENGANPNLVFPDDIAAIHLAAGIQSPLGRKIMELLLIHGGDTAIRSVDGLTPVHVSAAWGCTQTLEVLLEYGGNPDDIDDCGKTAWDFAKDINHLDVLDMLWRYKRKTSPNLHSNEKLGDADGSAPKPTYLVDKYLHTDEASNESFIEERWSTIRATTDIDTFERQLKSCNIDTIDDGGAPKEPVHLHQSISNSVLFDQLRDLGADPGPVTPTTRGVYLQRLTKILQTQIEIPKFAPPKPKYSDPLAMILRGELEPSSWKSLEESLRHEFHQCPVREPGQKCDKFNYLLVDPRISDNLPHRAEGLSTSALLQNFIEAVFYIGCGTKLRPFQHLTDAAKCAKQVAVKATSKEQRIIDIWNCKFGVVVVDCFRNCCHDEAHTREACMIDAIGKAYLTNEIQGSYKGKVKDWPRADKFKLGAYMLYQAMQMYIIEGERQFFRYGF